MTRKAKIALGVAVGAGTVLALGWMVFRPKFGTAPMAELEKLIDPRLLEGKTLDPAGVERWNRYVEALKAVKGDASPPGTFQGEPYLATNRAAIAKVQAILDEGPLYHRSSILNASDSYPMFAQMKTIAKASSFAAKSRAGRGDCKGAIDALEISFKLLEKVRLNESSYIEDLVNVAIEAILLSGSATVARNPRLSDDQALRLIALIPASPTFDKPLANAIRGEFQGYVLPWLDDPKSKLAKLNVGAMLFTSGDPDEAEPKNQGLFGNYDPYATTKAANKIYLSVMLNTSKPASKIDMSWLSLQDEFAKELPESPDLSKTGWQSEAGMFWFKVRMNNLSNSFGKIMLTNSFTPTTLVDMSFRMRSQRELVRALAALSVFRKRHGKLPDNLGQLVSTGLLQAEPHDFFAEAPLRYEPKRGLLYSINQNRKDDAGSFAGEAQPLQPDFGYRVTP